MSYFISSLAHLLLIAFIITILALRTANGADCYLPSQQFNKLNDEYYDLGLVKKISEQEKKSINDFFQSISGRWKGEFFVLECEGTEKEPRVVSNKGRVIAEICQESEGVLIIESHIDYTTDKPSSFKKIKTLGWNSIFTIDQNTKEQLAFTEKFRKGVYRGGFPLVEHVFQITHQSDKRLDILQTIYYNGVYSIEERWTLSK